MGIATLLTDFGTTDYYVAAVKGTLLRLAPGHQLVDLSHEVPPGDVQAASWLLAGASPSFPESTLHMAVVDPGVGTNRRILAVESAGMTFLAPDNGLLTPILEGVAPWTDFQAFAVDRPDLYLASPGSTFHGRDRFAPAAAFLLRGGKPAELGPVVEDPLRASVPPPNRGKEVLKGRVVHIDRFGNLITNVPTAWLGEHFQYAEVENQRATCRVGCYAQLPPDEAGVIPGSLGTLEISLDGASLARRWNISRGIAVRFVSSC